VALEISMRLSHYSILILIPIIILTGSLIIYAFRADDLTKTDTSGPDLNGSVIIPENYRDLIVLDVSIPAFDAEPAVEDLKLHNGTASSHPGDVLRQFALTDWYSDHDGDSTFDGNQVSGDTEAIISSDDDILSPDDNVRRSGLARIELFDYSNGTGEQYIDSDRSGNYDNGEAVVRTSTSAGEIHPGEVISSGAADMTYFPDNIRFADGINGNVNPARYNSGEALVISDDDILDESDSVITPGNADLKSLSSDFVYSDSNNDGRYTVDEAIIMDGGVYGQLDTGSLNGSGTDTVVRPGTANLKPLAGGDLLFADSDGNNIYSHNELIAESADNILESGEVILPGFAGLQSMTGLHFADANDDDQLDATEPIIENNGIYEEVLEIADIILIPGGADLKTFNHDTEMFIDSDRDGFYDNGECIVHDKDGIRDMLSASDDVVKPGPAFLTNFSVDIKWADSNYNNVYDHEELIVNSPDDVLSPGEVVKPGYCDLKHLYQGYVYSDDNGDGLCSQGELVIYSADKILDSGDTVDTPGRARLLSLKDNSSTWFIDTDNGKDFDQSEAIIYEGNGDSIPYLDYRDAIARSGQVDIKNFGDEMVYIDHNGDGNFKGDSDNDVNWDDSDDSTWANDPDVVIDQDEVVLYDQQGVNHLALDPGDVILRPGMALLTAFPDTDVYTDDGDGGYDGNAFNEAIVRDNNSNLILDDTDEVITSGRAIIRDFDPPTAERYIDANNDGVYSPDEAIIIDSGPGGTPNGLLDVGLLDGSGVDQVVTSGLANLEYFDRAEKFLDGNHNSAYDSGEAVVYDWYKPDEPYKFEGELILAGDQTSNPPSGSLEYQEPGNRTHDSVLLASSVGTSSMINLNHNGEYKYIDNNHSGVYDSFYTGLYEPIIWSVNNDLEEGNLDGTGTDHVLAAGYASMKSWAFIKNPSPDYAERLKWTDHNQDGEYQSNEAIVYDAIGDDIITFIGAGMDDDKIIVPGEADLRDFINMKYVDANGNDIFDQGELKVNDANQDNMVQNDEIQEPGAVPFLMSFSSASYNYRYCDSDSDGVFDPYEPVIIDYATLGVLEEQDEVLTAGEVPLSNFNPDTDRYTDSSHNGQYDYYPEDGFGDAIIVNVTGNAELLESSDRIETEGYADLRSLTATAYKYSDADNNEDLTNGELIINDTNSDDLVNPGEIVRSGLAGLRQFSDNMRYADDDRDDLYSASEAIIRTSDLILDSDDEVLASGGAGLHIFEQNTYRFADSNHNGSYDADEAIVVEADWVDVDDALEDSDIILLEGRADLERLPDNIMFLDDEADSDTYEDGEAIVSDLNDNFLLDTGEIITGGRASLEQFSNRERYTDSGNHNSQYDPDEAIIRDGNYNGRLDNGNLNSIEQNDDAVITSGKSTLTGFESDGLPASPNCDDEHYVDTDGNGMYDGTEDIYMDRDNNDVVTMGNDALEYFVVKNMGTATNSDLAAVKLWADRDRDGQFEPYSDDSPAIKDLITDPSDPKLWFEGPAISPPLSSPSFRDPIDYNMPSEGQRFFVTVDISISPINGRDIQMALPVNGAKTSFGFPGPSDTAAINAYTQKIDYANPHAAQITSPTDGAVIYGQVTLRANAADSIAIGKVEFYKGLPGDGNTLIAVDDGGSPWEAIWDVGNEETGLYTLYARVYDKTYLRPPPSWGINHYRDSSGVSITITTSSSVELSGGWNLISLPVESLDSSIDSVLSSINGSYTSVWTYNRDSGKPAWLRYDLESPDFLNDLNIMETGAGYWIYMSDPGTVNIAGTASDTAVNLYSGWNLVGCKSLTALNIYEATASISGDFSVWTFDPENEVWINYAPGDPSSDLSEIEPWKGYWIYTTEDCLWYMGTR
jgi:hypothetical protein